MKMTWMHMEFVFCFFYYRPKPSQTGQNGLAAAADASLADPVPQISHKTERVSQWVSEIQLLTNKPALTLFMNIPP